MATDYRFAIGCWQDQAGSENAKANIFVGGTQVATEVEITATSADSPQVVSFEATGLADRNSDGSVTVPIKVVLVNEYYVDSGTDRNIWIKEIRYTHKHATASGSTDLAYWNGSTKVTDFSDLSNYVGTGGEGLVIPTAVTGNQIADDWWSGRGDTSFFYIPVWGDAADTGTTITVALK